MSNAIRFFVKATGANAPSELDYFIRDDGTVWRDNEQTCESQCAVVGFDDFILPCPEIGWEVVTSSSALRPAAQPVGEPVAYAVMWGAGPMRKHSVHFELPTAEQVAAEVTSNKTMIRPLVFGDTTPQPSPERVPMTEFQRGTAVIHHLGPEALAGGKLSLLDVFHIGITAAEAHHGITTPKADK